MTPDTADNNVDNDLTISFDEDAVWSSKVTAIKVGNTGLDDGQYTITNGQLTIKNGVIQTPGNYTITVEATGYQNSSVVQTVNVGAISLTKSTAVLSPDPDDWVYEPEVNVLTLTAKDKYGNPIPNYQFKMEVILQNHEASDLIMVADGNSYTGHPNDPITFPLTDLSQVTDANGVVTLSYHIPSGSYHAELWIYFNDGETVFW